MNIFKQLFAKKPATLPISDIVWPVTITKNQEAYIKAWLDVFLEVESFEDLKRYGNDIWLDWGGAESSHIIYFGAVDLYILMQPETKGWTATHVWIDRIENADGNSCVPKNSTFLFKIPNSVYSSDGFVDDDNHYHWMEYAKVYKWDD